MNDQSVRKCDAHNYFECQLCAVDNGSVYNKCMDCGLQRRFHIKDEECNPMAGTKIADVANCASKCKKYAPRLVPQHIMDMSEAEGISTDEVLANLEAARYEAAVDGNVPTPSNDQKAFDYPRSGERETEPETSEITFADVQGIDGMIIESPASAPAGTKCCTPVGPLSGGQLGEDVFVEDVDAWICGHGIEWHRLDAGRTERLTCTKCKCEDWAPTYTNEIYAILETRSKVNRPLTNNQQLDEARPATQADDLAEWENDKAAFRDGVQSLLDRIDSVMIESADQEVENDRLREQINNAITRPETDELRHATDKLIKVVVEHLEKELGVAKEQLVAMTGAYGLQHNVAVALAVGIHDRHNQKYVSYTTCDLPHCVEVRKVFEDAL